MALTLHLGRRFPLVARRRPSCPPLQDRVSDLELRAHAADDPVKTTAVLNLAALLASDAGEHALARTWCHTHARTWLSRLPGTGKEAIHALEPVVNLARLHLRAGRGDDALTLLNGLYEGVARRRDTVLDEVHVPCSHLVRDTGAYREVLQWVWSVLLADGTRALTSAGHWQQALVHLESYRGIGSRMADGRQVAVLAHLDAGQAEAALKLVEDTAPGTPWEEAVTATLAYMCAPGNRAATRMSRAHGALEWVAGMEVFHTRLTLTIAENLGDDWQAELLAPLVDNVLAAGNGYCAREVLDSTEPAPRGEELRWLVSTCGLGTGLPENMRQRTTKLVDALLDER